MTVVLHKHKIACGNVLCLIHIFVAERHPDSCNIIRMSLFNEKLEDSLTNDITTV